MVEADSLAHFTATRKKIGFAHLASPLGIVFCQWHGLKLYSVYVSSAPGAWTIF
jgi:hypothetical protein